MTKVPLEKLFNALVEYYWEHEGRNPQWVWDNVFPDIFKEEFIKLYGYPLQDDPSPYRFYDTDYMTIVLDEE